MLPCLGALSVLYALQPTWTLIYTDLPTPLGMSALVYLVQSTFSGSTSSCLFAPVHLLRLPSPAYLVQSTFHSPACSWLPGVMTPPMPLPWPAAVTLGRSTQGTSPQAQSRPHRHMGTKHHRENAKESQSSDWIPEEPHWDGLECRQRKTGQSSETLEGLENRGNIKPDG